MKLFNDYKHKIKYPIEGSYKLDGIFCTIENKRPFSKEGKEFKVIPDLDYPDGTEGELYNHNLTFEEIVGAVKRDVPNSNTSLILFFEHSKLPKYRLNNEEDVYILLENALLNKYEGIVLSTEFGLLKLKPTLDEEYIIEDVIEGKGKLQGKAGKIVFENFTAGINGTHAYLEKLWSIKDTLIGKLATVQFQNKTSNNIPRFPKVKSIRDYE